MKRPLLLFCLLGLRGVSAAGPIGVPGGDPVFAPLGPHAKPAFTAFKRWLLALLPAPRSSALDLRAILQELDFEGDEARAVAAAAPLINVLGPGKRQLIDITLEGLDAGHVYLSLGGTTREQLSIGDLIALKRGIVGFLERARPTPAARRLYDKLLEKLEAATRRRT